MNYVKSFNVFSCVEEPLKVALALRQLNPIHKKGP